MLLGELGAVAFARGSAADEHAVDGLPGADFDADVVPSGGGAAAAVEFTGAVSCAGDGPAVKTLLALTIIQALLLDAGPKPSLGMWGLWGARHGV